VTVAAMSIMNLFGNVSVFLNFKFFCLKFNYFFIILDCFDVLMLKIIFKNKKFYFNIFINKKHFELQPLSQFQAYEFD
jgi:hypothetical protein